MGSAHSVARWSAGALLILSPISIAALVASCTGSLGGDPGSGSKTGPDGPSDEALSELGVSGMRRLTATEYDASVRDLLGVDVDSQTALPEDLRTPFDNDFTKQQASEALVTSVEVLAGNIAEQVATDAALLDAILPCTPSGPTDEACFREFVQSFGRRALRRPLTDVEVDAFATFMDHATQSGDFNIAIDSALRGFLQHPEFLYRVELGQAIEGEPGVFRLSDYELGARMSYFLLGSTTPDWLLDAAEAGDLSDAAGITDATRQLLDDPRSHERIARFHSMWMGYENLPHGPELAEAMQMETQALLDKILFEEKRPWVDLIRSEEPYLNTFLADHYGLPDPSGGEGWVPYGDSGRRGLLSQGSFLSAVAKFTDTSPVQRGLLIRTRLFCQTINRPPPDVMVDTDNPPESADPNACKSERYNMWQTDGCSLCHALLEPVGFGLENYDIAGRYRETEIDRPDCPIDGEGSLEGIGTFQGPAELAELMLQAGDMDSCVAKQLYRFAMGRFELDEADERFIARVVEVAQGGTDTSAEADTSAGAEGAGQAVASGDLIFHDLLLEFVSSESFRHRREESIDE